MGVDYTAFVGGKEIDSFYSGEKEIEEIWGGNTLLWQKESIPDTSVHCALRFIFENGIYVKDPYAGENNPPVLVSDEAGFSVWGSVTPKKIAYHIKKAETSDYLSRRAYEVAVGLTLNEDKNFIIVGPYNARNGSVKGPAFGSWYQTRKGSDGVYSWEGNYGYSYVAYSNSTSDDTAVLKDDNVKAIKTTGGARIFYNLEKMKAWLLSDD